MPLVAKNRKVDNTEIENTSVGLNTLNYPHESINTCGTGSDSEWKNDSSTSISD